jgi:hypothetical protein
VSNISSGRILSAHRRTVGVDDIMSYDKDIAALLVIDIVLEASASKDHADGQPGLPRGRTGRTTV